MKKKISRHFVKQVMAGIFALALIVVGACFMPTEGKEVLAADAYTADTYTADEVKGYLGVSAPTPKDTAYAGWVFAGWMDAEGNVVSEVVDGATYSAKFVSPEVLSVKIQVPKDTNASTEKTNMRLISSVDGLSYSGAGFEVYYNGATECTLNAPANTVFQRIVASSTSGVAYNFGPKIVDTKSEYFMTYTLLDIIKDNYNKVFEIRPYWKTLDGVTVYGVTRFVKVEDYYNNVTNVPVYLGKDVETVDYTAAAITSTGTMSGVTVATDGYQYDETTGWANFRVKMTFAEGYVLPSASTITVTVNGETHSTIYRNSTTSYLTNGTADTSWYTEYAQDENEIEFVIATSADLYGFASLSSSTGFSGEKFYLASDIVANNGGVTSTTTDGVTTYSWAEDSTDGTSYGWTRILDSTAFAGTFDGCGHTITGIYISGANGTMGLFGTTGACEIKNFNIEDSYHASTNAAKPKLGMIIGNVAGATKLTNVQCEAYLSTTTTQTSGWGVGGLVGYVSAEGSEITDCSFSGNITIAGGFAGGIVGSAYNSCTVSNSYCDADLNTTATGTSQLGGIVGRAQTGGTLAISNCWFAGNITTAGKYAGGILGAVVSGTSNSITDCLNTGVVKSTNSSSPFVGGIFGTVTGGSLEVDITRCLGAGTVSGAAAYSGSVYGGSTKSSTVSITDTYATVESCERQVGTSATDASGEVATVVEDSIIGISAYYNMDSISALSAWVVQEGYVPAPQSVAKSELKENTITANLNWYNNAADGVGTSADNPYTISNAGELYGLALLVNGNVDSFEGKYIQLTANITLNDGWNGALGIKEDGRPETPDAADNMWIPVGTSTYPFKGNFDGNNNTIFGMYINKTVDEDSKIYSGLFGNVEDATIKNFALKNGYIYVNTGAGLESPTGSVAGYGAATIENVYSNVGIYAVNTLTTGGLIGKAVGADSESAAVTLINCWYDGNLVLRTGSIRNLNVGGIIGYAMRGVIDLEHVLSTGIIDVKVSKNYSTAQTCSLRVAGFVGRDTSSATIAIDDSLAATNINVAESENVTFNHVAMILGRKQGTLTIGSAVYISGEEYSAAINSDSSLVETTVVPVTYWSDTLELNTSYWTKSSTIPVLSGLNSYAGYLISTASYLSSTSATSLVGEVTRYATISAPTFDLTGLSTTSSETEDYYSTTHTGQQGGYFDGRYLYQSFLKYCYNNTKNEDGTYYYSGNNKNLHDENNLAVIVKYDVLEQEVVAVSKQLYLYHAANITYNSTKDCLVIGYGTPYPRVVGYMNKDTLELLDGSPFSSVYYVSGFGYNSETDSYIIRKANTFRIGDIDIKEGSASEGAALFTGITEATAYTAQPICCDEDYIYCLYYGNGTDQIDDVTPLTTDAIIVYDWDGNFVTFIEVDFGGEEPESISVVNGDIYVTTGANSNAYFYKVTGLSVGTKDVRITAE